MQQADPERYKLLTSISLNTSILKSGVNDVQKALMTLNATLTETNSQATNRNVSPIINMTNTFNCPGVTADEVLESISSQLGKAFEGLFANAYQRSMIHV